MHGKASSSPLCCAASRRVRLGWWSSRRSNFKVAQLDPWHLGNNIWNRWKREVFVFSSGCHVSTFEPTDVVGQRSIAHVICFYIFLLFGRRKLELMMDSKVIYPCKQISFTREKKRKCLTTFNSRQLMSSGQIHQLIDVYSSYTAGRASTLPRAGERAHFEERAENWSTLLIACFC